LNGKDKSIHGSSHLSCNSPNQTNFINNRSNHKKNNLFINNHLRVDKSITNDSQKSPSSISQKGSANNKQNIKNNQSSCSSNMTPSSVKNSKNRYKSLKYNKEPVITIEDLNYRQRFNSVKDKPITFGENGYPSIKLDRIFDEPAHFEKDKTLIKDNYLKVQTSYYINDRSSRNDKDYVEKKKVEENPNRRNNNNPNTTTHNLCDSYKDTLQLNNLLAKVSYEKCTEFNRIIIFNKKTFYYMVNCSGSQLLVVIS
jgi:hypothetical protein